MMGGGGASKYKMAESEMQSMNYSWLLSPNCHESFQFTVEQFEVKDPIGKGKFGLVFWAEIPDIGKYIAIKFIPKKILFESKAAERIQQEINILRRIDHPFIIHYFGGFTAPGAVALVFEYASGGELFTRMKKLVKFSENIARFYFCEIACALGYLHNLNIVYRDLKPENILLDNGGHIKLCDFGFASVMTCSDAVLNDGCGTAMYVAPEIASGHMKKAHGLPVDWWGLGCILFEMLAGDPPFGDTDKMSKFEVFNNIIGKNVTFPISMGSDAKTLVKSLLAKNPQERIAFQGVRQSAWVAEVNWEALSARRITPPWSPPNASSPHRANFVSWPGISVPSSASAQENNYASNIDFSCPMKRSGLTIGGAEIDNKLRRKSSAKMKNEYSGGHSRSKSMSMLSAAEGQDSSDMNGSFAEVGDDVNKRKKSSADLMTRRQSSMKRREGRDIPLY